MTCSEIVNGNSKDNKNVNVEQLDTDEDYSKSTNSSDLKKTKYATLDAERPSLRSPFSTSNKSLKRTQYSWSKVSL